MKKIYISGAVTKVTPEKRERLFQQAEDFLQEDFDEVINPLKIVPPDLDWNSAMKICYQALLDDDCNTIAMLPNWKGSVGAKRELRVATDCGYEVIYL